MKLQSCKRGREKLERTVKEGGRVMVEYPLSHLSPFARRPLRVYTDKMGRWYVRGARRKIHFLTTYHWADDTFGYGD